MSNHEECGRVKIPVSGGTDMTIWQWDATYLYMLGFLLNGERNGPDQRPFFSFRRIQAFKTGDDDDEDEDVAAVTAKAAEVTVSEKTEEAAAPEKVCSSHLNQ